MDDEIDIAVPDAALLRAQTLLREQFGDLASARMVPVGLADLLADLDEPTRPDNPRKRRSGSSNKTLKDP